MDHGKLVHILRAARAASGESRLLVIGSQSILGKFPDAPRELRESREVDIATPDDPIKSELIDGSIGEYSQFDKTFGVYGHGVEKETAILPPDWESRAILRTFDEVPATTIVFLHPDDAAFSKLAAGREKDFAWVKGVFKHRLCNQGSVAKLILECADEKLKKKLSRNFHISTGHTPAAVQPKHLSLDGIRPHSGRAASDQSEPSALEKPDLHISPTPTVGDGGIGEI